MSKASAYFTVNSIGGKHGAKELKSELDKLAGVISVSVSDSSGNIAVDFDTTGVRQEDLKTKIENLGYDITNVRLENHIM
ncbi:MAG: heavy metal-associated domain protein [Clostridiales bacterium]|nr:heavy metal-associated domain protein [Clostridiales bacterium]